MTDYNNDVNFISCGCALPSVKPADVTFNTEGIIHLIRQAREQELGILLFPELAVTGYTCADLFFQQQLMDVVQEALVKIAAETAGTPQLICLGAPLSHLGRLYNCGVLIQDGRILAAVPKRYLPDNREYYEKRWFTEGGADDGEIVIGNQHVPFGTDLLLRDVNNPEFIVGVEVCEDLWAPAPPSQDLAAAGAVIILNPSASNETIGKASYRKALVSQQSARLDCAYLYASCGFGESTTDVVFGGDSLIAENGRILAASKRFSMEPGITQSQIDPELLLHDRRMQASFRDFRSERKFRYLPCFLLTTDTITREIDNAPFVPADSSDRSERCLEISNIQAQGLAARLMHIGGAPMVVGVSGGLDSTLALLVCSYAARLCGIPAEKIHAVTMPGFGTTDRTYTNAVELIRELGATLHEIPIGKAATEHLNDIGHDIDDRNEVYENAQARERTQILMDLANEYRGIVVGTGDLSELALGWATYNGDHMSMYGVNAGVPKTLVRYLVAWYADHADEKLAALLRDILDTPVSPELLPPKDGKIAQKTEDLVGPYELHDFFLFQFLRNGFSPEKIFDLAVAAFDGAYDEKTIARWLETFYRRFFSQQFKRSCLPDGPKVGSVTLSPRGDWRMPSDASAREFVSRAAAIRNRLDQSCI
ncbi:MAG: NAD(+) synthase [Eubacteriaceae bacterium]|jgi:NAD+ synthase (glutamine-hydrolysing)